MNRKPIIFIVSFLILIFAASVFAQETVTPEDAAKFIGQQKTVCGTVASAHHATRSKGQPTFLNLNKPYRTQFLLSSFGDQIEANSISLLKPFPGKKYVFRGNSKLQGRSGDYCQGPLTD